MSKYRRCRGSGLLDAYRQVTTVVMKTVQLVLS